MYNGHLENLIEKRRSIRKYKDILPAEELIEQILKCALWAPSPSNMQPVRYIKIETEAMRKHLYFHIQKGKELLIDKCKKLSMSKKIKRWIEIYYQRYCKFIFDAPIIFAVGVTTIKNGFYKNLKSLGLYHKYDHNHSIDISIGLSISNFILKAEELGLGTCILTTPFMFIENINEIFNIKNIDIRCFITLGFPAEIPDPPERFSISDIYIKL